MNIKLKIKPTENAYYENGEYVQNYEIDEIEKSELEKLIEAKGQYYIDNASYTAHYEIVDEDAEEDSCCNWQDWENNYIDDGLSNAKIKVHGRYLIEKKLGLDYGLIIELEI